MEQLDYAFLSDFGLTVLRNCDVFNKRGYKMKPSPCRAGYLRIWYTKENGKRGNISLHRLMAFAFIPNPDNKSDVNHKDCNKSNNDTSNLEWTSRSENMAHALANNRMTGPRLKEDVQIKKRIIKQLYASDEYTQDDLAKAFGLSHTRIVHIVNEAS